MSREIIEAVRTIEKEKGIEEDTLIHALEDALQAAYKKTPGSSRHASVELDPDSGDFRVYAIELPKDIEERLIEGGARAADHRARGAGGGDRRALARPRLRRRPADRLVRRRPGAREARRRHPENFGRIAAQTAKQVILQRIREASAR
jgi:N utilization substance protein A